jgi:hypothetical protein
VEAEVDIRSVEEKQTRSGNTRYVVRDADGKEYTTFRPAIGRAAQGFEGRRAHITWHEEERNGFQNVYLDAIAETASPAGAPGEGAAGGGGDGHDPDEVAWSTAVEAAPWLLGSREPQEAVEPEDFFERLEPFKRLVAEDIREGSSGPDADEAS